MWDSAEKGGEDEAKRKKKKQKLKTRNRQNERQIGRERMRGLSFVSFSLNTQLKTVLVKKPQTTIQVRGQKSNMVRCISEVGNSRMKDTYLPKQRENSKHVKPKLL